MDLHYLQIEFLGLFYKYFQETYQSLISLIKNPWFGICTTD